MAKPTKASLAERLGRMDPLASWGERLWNWTRDQWLTLLGLVTAGGGVSLLALITDWARALGPLGVFLIALAVVAIFGLAVAMIRLLAAKRRLKVAEAGAVDK